MNYVIDQFTQEDTEITDNEYHKRIRNKVTQPPSTIDDRPFTSNEIGEIIKNMDGNKAPGEDGVTADVLLHVFHMVPSYLTAVYNKCLEAGTFPSQWKRATIVLIVKPGK